ncbi:ABC transporter ATP-binding protein [Picrophilus oshimae]|uniref:Multi drug ABC transporter ATP binding protein n=1 Tax=Picrophilus torridus (strain ATCC 700027 / DSM 9790 / JCM 10055 / NBRC 100828 / KAW 2/3) TaxID=1122961 RepID=Q6KYW8_PICTO|nr:ABC transporter ATP-binding protein [Picrophilus oshimae]AAT44084.1 multi drug ABC transporter ATP binding protein [Picrophilus oshimae DSM 9789]
MEISIRNLTKRYGRILALNKINMHASGPGCIAILGPNGAGKTTMLKLISNIIKPTDGSVLINNINVSDYPERALKYLGALIEQPEFYYYLNGYEILKFAAKVKGLKNNIDDEIKRLADLTDMNDYLYRKTGTYSRGMKQRLALAVAMIGDPEIIILDEPTFGLDPKGMAYIRDLIKNLSREKLVILSTHLIYEAKEVSNRTLIIDHGEIKYDSINSDNKRKILVTFDGSISNIKSDFIRDFVIDKNRIIITPREDADNYNIIYDLIKNGVKVNSAQDYDDLEETYISITS